ncbi:MAG TPA: glucose-6-phosphate dehydrogenase assembly protein OpcA [Acidimicrobiales bacterium]|nr:glucose-6-phosphate dehydrogenase assembly protein OpcA [Acidimicrobiales bacterium]
MAEPVTAAELGAWRGEGVGLGEVIDALTELRRVGHRTATRTSVVNLVVLADDEAEAARACAAIQDLGGRHPGRSIVVVREPDGGAQAVDAEVTLHGAVAEGHSVWSEDVVLRVRGEVQRHLDSLIEPLTLPDLPVAAWLVGTVVEPSDALLASADAVVVDSREAGDPGLLASIAELSREHTVVDLSWIRLRPWRELLARLFDGAAFRPFVAGVTRARVTGKPGPRHLLGGWLVSRLGLPHSAVELVDGLHVAVHLEARAGGKEGSFTVGRADDRRLLRATARVEDGPSYDDRLGLPEVSLPWSLAEALTHLERDRTHEEAVEGALGFAS